MKRIETRLEQLESKAAAARSAQRGYCKCSPEIVFRDPVTVDKLPQEQGKRPPIRINGACHRCGGTFDKAHPAPPTIILQPVKVEQ